MDCADLESLELFYGDTRITLIPGFTKECNVYSSTVPNTFANVHIDTLADDADTTIFISNDCGNRTVQLKVGKNEIDIVVQSADEQHQKVYKVKVLRLTTNNATLSMLSLDGGTLNPSFDARVTHYSANVPARCSEILISHDTLDPLSQVNANGTPANQESITVPIGSGKTSITLDVLAADGVTTGQYVLQCYRETLGCARVAPTTDQIFWGCPIYFSVPYIATRALTDTQVLSISLAHLDFLASQRVWSR